MKHKRFLSILSLSFLAACSLASCGGGDEPGPGPDPDPDPTPDPKPDPDPDGPTPDEPQTLQQRNLQIHVNDRWEIIHDMVID